MRDGKRERERERELFIHRSYHSVGWDKHIYIYIYIYTVSFYILTLLSVCIDRFNCLAREEYIYIYIYIKRELEGERDRMILWRLR